MALDIPQERRTGSQEGCTSADLRFVLQVLFSSYGYQRRINNAALTLHRVAPDVARHISGVIFLGNYGSSRATAGLKLS